MSKTKELSFACDPDLSKYVDSMLFHSGKVIATGKYNCGEKLCTISLEVRGDIAVEYLGTIYHDPESYPEDLIAKIKANPGVWDMCAPSGEGNDDEENANIYIHLGNWFEYMTENDRSWIEGFMYDGDLSTETPESIRSEMAELAADILERSSYR